MACLQKVGQAKAPAAPQSSLNTSSSILEHKSREESYDVDLKALALKGSCQRSQHTAAHLLRNHYCESAKSGRSIPS